MLRVAELADSYGSGEIRLTVWQNFIIPNVPDAFVPTLKKALEKAGFATKQSHLASGVIACLGTRVRGADGYHVFVGGGFGRNQTVGRQIFSGVSANELPLTLEKILRAYLKHRQGKETFQQFTTRHEVGKLQEMFE